MPRKMRLYLNWQINKDEGKLDALRRWNRIRSRENKASWQTGKTGKPGNTQRDPRESDQTNRLWGGGFVQRRGWLGARELIAEPKGRWPDRDKEDRGEGDNVETPFCPTFRCQKMDKGSIIRNRAINRLGENRREIQLIPRRITSYHFAITSPY